MSKTDDISTIERKLASKLEHCNCLEAQGADPDLLEAVWNEWAEIEGHYQRLVAKNRVPDNIKE